MNLESIFKLSVLVNLVDHMSAPMGGINQTVDTATSRLNQLNQQFKGLAQTGVALTAAGVGLTKAVTAPVESTYDTKKAFGELRSVGIENLKAIEDAAIAFTNTYSGTLKPEFVAAAYDIKSGISQLSDEAVAGYTYIAALTGKGTKSTVEEMTDLFATGYGIYKSYYKDMSDLEFAGLFSAGISKSVQQFKTTGSGMQQSISTLGKSASNANVPLEEQFSILGMLQQTMSGSEAGTKYKAFLKSVTKAGDTLQLKFLDANNQLLSMPEILVELKNKYGDTLDAVEKMELQKAFGTEEAVALIDLLYPKIGELETNILSLYNALGQGTGVAEQMAQVMNTDPGSEKTIKEQVWHNLKEQLGGALQPTMTKFNDLLIQNILNMQLWVEEHPKATAALMNIALALGVVLTVLGTVITLIGVGGVAITTAWKYISVLRGGLRLLIGALFKGFVGIKSFTISLIRMTAQGIMAGIRALPGLISTVWSFTAALLANPVTWVVIGIVALAAGLYLLWKHFDTVSAFLSGTWQAVVAGLGAGFEWIRGLLGDIPDSVLILLAVFMPFVGIPLLIIKHWGRLSGWFSTLWLEITTDFTGFVRSMPRRIVSGLRGMFDWIKSSIQEVPDSVLLLVTAFMPLVGIPLLIIKHWDDLPKWFSTLWTNITTDFTGFITEIPRKFIEGFGAGFDWLKKQISQIPDTVLIAIAAFNPFLGIPLLIISHWDGLEEWFSTLWSNVKSNFSSFVSYVPNRIISGFGAGFNWLESRLQNVPNVVLIAVAGFLPFLGIPLLIIKNWGSLSEWFNTLWTNITTDFSGFIESLPQKILEKLGMFRESGRKIMETLAAGIKSAVSAPVNAVKNGLDEIRKMLPFSDAKVGPLSQLTHNGRKVFETIATGMEQSAPALIRQTQFAFAGITDNFDDESLQIDQKMNKPVKTVDLKEIVTKIVEKETRIETSKETGAVVKNYYSFNFDNVEDVNTIIEAYKRLKDDTEGDEDDGEYWS